MKSAPSKANRGLLVWATAASVIAGGLFVWPLHLIVVSGQNSVLALIAGGLWALAIAGLSSVYIPSGRWVQGINTGMALVACVGMMCVDALMLVELTGMLQTFFYFETPRWALITPLIVLIVWMARQREMVLWRVVALWIPVLSAGSLGIFALALTNVHFGRALIPNQQILIRPLTQGLAIIAYLGWPFGVTLRTVRSVLGEPPQLGIRLTTAVTPWLVFSMLYGIAVGALGPQAVMQLRWPVVFTLDHVTLDSTFFLSRIGIVVVFGWTVGMVLGLTVHVRVLMRNIAPIWSALPPYIPYAAGLMWWIAGFAVATPNTASTLLVTGMDPIAATYLASEMGWLLFLRGSFWWAQRTRRKTITPTSAS